MPKLILLVVLFSGCTTAKQPVVEWAFVEYEQSCWHEFPKECFDSGANARCTYTIPHCEQIKTGRVLRLEQVGE